ncbi:MAG: ABC transporter permease [Lachnospiraceae bacterium]|nr:ABC transporter permease [Lachnospiraceae bacterium]
MDRVKKILSGKGLLLITIAMFLFCCVFNSAFLSRMNISGLLVEISYMSFLAMGMSFVILTGGIDLSVAANAGLATVMVAYTMKYWYTGNDGTTIVLAIVLALLASSAIGLLNGVMVAYFNLPPLVVTLAVTWIATGIANRMIKGAPIALSIRSFRKILIYNIGNWVPVMFLITIALLFLLSYILEKLRFGRETYAVGSSYYASFISGIKVKHVLLRSYVICGLFAGIAGLMISANLSSGYASAATDYEIYTIAAVVMGGISLNGGEGKLRNAFVGVIFLRILKKIVVFTGLSNISGFIEGMIVGSILVLVLFFNSLRKEKN